MKTHFVQEFPEGFRVVNFAGDVKEFFDFSRNERGVILNKNQQQYEAEKKAAKLSKMTLDQWQKTP